MSTAEGVPRRDRGSGGLPVPVTILVGLAAAGFVLGTMRVAQDVLAPAILALVLAIAMSPLQAQLRKWLPGWLALTLSLVITYTGLSVFAAAIGWALYEFGTGIRVYEAEYNALVANVTRTLADYGINQEQIDGVLGAIDLGQVANIALDVASGLYGAVSLSTLSLTLLFFMIVDGGSFSERFAAVKRIRPGVAASLTEFGVGVRRYLVVTTVFGAIVAIVDVGLLLVLGVPLAFVWGVLAFITGYIPTVGLVIGLVPPVIIALLDGGWTQALAVLIGYLVINNTIQSVIQPKFIGDAVGLGIATSFASLVLWGFVLGPLGALLAIPMTLMARALLTDSDPRHTWLSILLGDKAPPDDRVRELAIATGAEPAEPDLADSQPDVPEPRGEPTD